MAKINLQWTNDFFSANTATIPTLTQTVERRIGALGTWEDSTLAVTPDGVTPTIFKATDETVTQEETTAKSYFYRIVTKNGEHVVTGNEVEVIVPAAMQPVDDLAGTFEA